MKKILSLSFLVLFFVATLVSCDNELLPNNEVAATESPQESAKEVPSVMLTQDEMILLAELSNGTPKISQEQAVDIANNFLNKGTLPSSLSKHGTIVPRCEVLTRTKRCLSKSYSTVEDADTMLYVFNYDNGYAVVSADVRVPERVLAFSDNGNLSLQTDNPGLSLFLDMAQDYVDVCIDDAEAKRDSVEISLTDKLLGAYGIDVDTVSPRLSKAKVLTQKILINTACWDHPTLIRTEVVPALIKTYWHQKWPYNDDAPVIGKKKCPAGCVSIAFSQLMAYWKWPKYGSNWNFDWTTILNNEESVYRNNEVARFVKYVGMEIATKYDTISSTTSAKNGLAMLKRKGYVVSNMTDYSFYSFNDVKNSLDNYCPVIISGRRMVKEPDSTSGHCWIVDGYVQKVFNVEHKRVYVLLYYDDSTRKTSDDVEINVYTTYDYERYLHFNWGGGVENSSEGYYAERVYRLNSSFTLNEKNELTATGPRYRNDYDYQYQVRIALNIHPKNK